MGPMGGAYRRWIAIVSTACVSCGGAENATDGEHENTGAIGLAIQQVPSDIKCIQITAAGSRVQSQSFGVTPLGSTTLVMRGIAPGTVMFSGAAFPIACPLLSTASIPTWVADPIEAVIVSGTQTNLTLTMRPAGSGGITVDFQGGVGGGVPLGIWDPTNWDNAIWQ
jgi:hypothetical protein